MRWIFRTNFRSFYLLNATQFLGALNDNIFKLIVMYLLIHIQGPENANQIASTVGAIFVIPFLLFSSAAGVLSDRISKRSIIVFTKALELLVMLFASVTVLMGWTLGLYIAVFLMAAQSAIFGPSKYGIIPELVEAKMISKANGSLTSLTYLAIILGTLLASVLTDLTNKNFFVITLFCNLIAIIGLVTSLGIGRTKPGRSPKKINPIFLYEIYQTVKISWKIPNMIICIFGASFFLFIGAFAQLNMIPFALQSLGLTEVGGGYLFLAVAIGVAIGALLSGKVSKDSVEPGISCIAGYVLAISILLLWLFSSSLIAVILLLAVIGIAGGAYAIPFDSFLQINSPQAHRGRIIAAANFFSFIGVLMAAIYLNITGVRLEMSAATSFAILGVFALIANTFMTGRLSFLLLPFLMKKLFRGIRKLKLLSDLPHHSKVILLESRSWLDPILLYTHIPRLVILSPGKLFRSFPWINGLFASIRRIPETIDAGLEEELQELLEKCKLKNLSVCIFIRKRKTDQLLKSYEETLKKLNIEHVHGQIWKEKKSKHVLGLHIPKKEVNLSMQKEIILS